MGTSPRSRAPLLRIAPSGSGAIELRGEMPCAGLMDEALAQLEHALGSVRNEAGPHGEGIFRIRLGVVHHLRGEYCDAEHNYRRALTLLNVADHPRADATALRRLGALHHERGDLKAAEQAHRAAAARVARSGDVRANAVIAGYLAAVLAEQGRRAQATKCLTRASADIDAIDDAVTLQTLRTLRGFLSAAGVHAKSRRAKRGASLKPVLQRQLSGVDAAIADDDLQLAARLADHRLQHNVWLAHDETTSHQLLVGQDASWIRPPDHGWQDLRQRGALRRIVVALVAARAEGVCALGVEDLQRAGWPNEVILHGAGANRVHVALAELRRRGLRSVLLRRDDGYILDPNVEITPWHHDVTPA